ncbi:MAG: response regulator [bacterium]
MNELNFKVLIVDDEQDFVETLSTRMETRGLKVDTALDGITAIDKVEHKTFDTIILDLAMPGIDGIETLKRMLAKNADLQVILLTGHATLEKGIEAIKLGAFDFLEKPAPIDLLMDKIKLAAMKKLALKEQRTSEQIASIMSKRGW